MYVRRSHLGMLGQTATCQSVGPQASPNFPVGTMLSNSSGVSGAATGLKIGAQAAGVTVQALTSAGIIAASGALGAVTMGIGFAVGIIAGIFAHHAAAVAKAQATLDPLVPAVEESLLSIINSYNSGQIDGPTAVQALATMQQQYYQGVAQIIKKGGPCPNPTSDPYGNYLKVTGKCNSACMVGCMLEGWAGNLQQMIQSGQGGTLAIAGIAPGTDFNESMPAWSLSVGCPPSIASSASSVGAAVSSVAASVGIPAWMIWVGGALVGAKILGVI